MISSLFLDQPENDLSAPNALVSSSNPTRNASCSSVSDRQQRIQKRIHRDLVKSLSETDNQQWEQSSSKDAAIQTEGCISCNMYKCSNHLTQEKLEKLQGEYSSVTRRADTLNKEIKHLQKCLKQTETAMSELHDKYSKMNVHDR